MAAKKSNRKKKIQISKSSLAQGNGRTEYNENQMQSVTGLDPAAANVTAQKLALVGPDAFLPRRETGLIIRDQAPTVSRGPVTATNEKGKGILVSNISGSQLRSELTSSIHGVGKGKSIEEENGAKDSGRGFFTRLLTLDNDAMDIIDKDPGGGLWVEEEDLDAIEKLILKQKTPTNQVAANTRSQPIGQKYSHLEALKNQLALAPSGVSDGFTFPVASGPTYTVPPTQVTYGPSSSLINQSRGYKYPGYQTQASEVGIWNSPGQWGPQLVQGVGEPSPQGHRQGLFDFVPQPAQSVIQHPEPAPVLDILQNQGYVGSDYQHDPMYYQKHVAEHTQMGPGGGRFAPEQWGQQQQVWSLHHQQQGASIDQPQQLVRSLYRQQQVASIHQPQQQAWSLYQQQHGARTDQPQQQVLSLYQQQQGARIDPPQQQVRSLYHPQQGAQQQGFADFTLLKGPRPPPSF